MNRRERRTQWQASHRAAALHSSALPQRPPASPTSLPSNVRMQIGALVLRGFEKRHASRIAASFERSLEQRLSADGLPQAMGHRLANSSLRLAPLTLRRSSDPVAIGEQLAASVVGFEITSRRRGASR